MHFTSHHCNAIAGDKCTLSCPEEVGASSTSFIGFDVECTAGEDFLRPKILTLFGKGSESADTRLQTPDPRLQTLDYVPQTLFILYF